MPSKEEKDRDKEEKRKKEKEEKEEERKKRKRRKEEKKEKKESIRGPREKVLKLNKDGKWQLMVAEIRLYGKDSSDVPDTSASEDSEGAGGSLTPPVLALYDVADTTKVLKKIHVKAIRESTYTGSRLTLHQALPPPPAPQSPGASQPPQSTMDRSSSSATLLTIKVRNSNIGNISNKSDTIGGTAGSASVGTLPLSPPPPPQQQQQQQQVYNSSIYYAVTSTKGKEYIFSLDYNRDIILVNYDDSDTAKKTELRKELAAIDQNFFAPLFDRVTYLSTRKKKSESRLRLSAHYDASPASQQQQQQHSLRPSSSSLLALHTPTSQISADPSSSVTAVGQPLATTTTPSSSCLL